MSWVSWIVWPFLLIDTDEVGKPSYQATCREYSRWQTTNRTQMIFLAQKEDSFHNLPGKLIGMVSCNPRLVSQARFTLLVKGSFPAVKTRPAYAKNIGRFYARCQFSVRAPTHAFVFALSVVLRSFPQPPKQILFSIECPVRSDISTVFIIWG